MSRYLNLASHPHPLTLREGTGAWFKCALCSSHGYGSFYRCPECSGYQIHETCAEAPNSLSFFGHEQHPLVLEPVIPGGSGRCCDRCTYCIHGIHYGCRACGFFLHPVCTKLPSSAVSPVHPQHLVTLVPGNGSRKCSGCSACYNGWHYTCAPCGIHLHTWCLLGDGKDHKKAPLCICG